LKPLSRPFPSCKTFLAGTLRSQSFALPWGPFRKLIAVTLGVRMIPEVFQTFPLFRTLRTFEFSFDIPPDLGSRIFPIGSESLVEALAVQMLLET